MTVRELIEKTGYEPLLLSDGDREITGGYAGDLLSWVMGRAESGDCWVTIMSNVNVAAVGQLTDCACIVFSEVHLQRPYSLRLPSCEMDRSRWRLLRPQTQE